LANGTAMKARLSSTLVASTVLLLAASASAQETVIVGGPPPRPGPGDQVYVVPQGSPVTIVLPQLPPPTVYAPAPAPPAPIVVAPAPVAAPPRPMAWVHLQGGSNLVLEAVLPGQTDWKPMCQAPCDVKVPIDALYHVKSPGMELSKAIQLAAAENDHVTLTVDPTSESTHAGGEALVILGGVAILTGGIILYVDAVESSICDTPYSGCSGFSKGVFWAGIGSAAVGAVGLGVGIKMMQPTSIEQTSGTVDPRERAAARDDRFRRSPVWRDALVTDAGPKATSIPLFSTSF
jgi:hypothetical protein